MSIFEKISLELVKRGLLTFFFSSHRSYFIKTCHGEKERGTSIFREHSTTESCILILEMMKHFHK